MAGWTRLEHHNEDQLATGVMAIEYDVGRGHVRTECSGLWSYRQAELHLRDWFRIVDAVRREGKPLFVLADLSGSAVQKPDVAQLLNTSTTDLYRDGDRVAVVVPSSLTKMQLRRVLDDRFHNYFLSRNAAETWLMAWTSGPFGRA